jgi:pilus assembly protein FimV
MLLAIAAVAVLVIGALGWIVMRRRNSGDDFHESILNTVTAMSPDANEADAAGGPTPGETSVLTDFAMSAIEGIQTEVGEVDLISEADVYLAYGRYSQAEEIIQSALTLNPDREDLKLKLLEIFHAAKEEEKFIQFAQEFHDTLGGESHPQWERISAMGYDLNPEHPLFGGGPVPQGADDLESLDTDDLSTPVDESLDELTEAAAETSDENELEFDVGSLDMGETESIEEEVQTEELASAEQTADTNELEFDVSSLDMGETESVEEEVVSEDVGLDLEAGTMEAAEESTEEAGLDFDVASLDVGEDSGGLESAAAELEAAMEEPSESESVLAESEELDAGDNILEFNLSDNEGLEEVVETAVVDEAPESGGDLDDLSLDLSDLGGDDEVFAGLDDADTKLDLAKAYIDMEDQDSAKSMLDEVVEEGTDEQKKQAQELLQKIG